MNTLQMNEQEKSVLRWGGIAGIVGGIFSILAIVFAEVIMPSAPAGTIALIDRFPEIRIFRVAENLTYLAGIICGICLCIALFWALRKKSLAPALFGSVLAIVGMISMAVFATPHVALNTLSNLYHSMDLTAEAQETLGLMWQATWGLSDAPLYVGFLVGMIGFTLLGVAMLRSSDFGKVLSWLSIVIGLASVVASIFQMIDPASFVGAVSFFAYVIFYFVLGIKIYRLSKAK